MTAELFILLIQGCLERAIANVFREIVWNVNDANI